MDGPLEDALVETRRLFTRADVSSDLRTLTKAGGRQADAFYRAFLALTTLPGGQGVNGGGWAHWASRSTWTAR